jgi:hypothetical protein
MENTMNTVNISLSEYNSLNSKLSNTQALLDQTKANLNLLQSQEKTNKVIVLEKREWDNCGGTKVKSSVTLDIKDPEVSKEILKVIEEVETSELSKTIEDQKAKIKNLTNSVEDLRDVLESTERSFRASTRSADESKETQIRKLKKGYEDAILDLEIEKETLVKSLADLKVNKTKEQLEVVRQQEILDLKDKNAALQEYKEKSEYLGFFKFKQFVANARNAQRFLSENGWINKLWKSTSNAMNELDTYVRLLTQVGKLPEKKQEINNCNCGKKGWVYPTHAYASVSCGSW